MGTFIKIPVEEATTPRNGYQCMCDRWWLVEDDCVLGFKLHSDKDWPAPQCNDNRLLVEKALKRNKDQTVVFLPAVFWPREPQD